MLPLVSPLAVPVVAASPPVAVALYVPADPSVAPLVLVLVLPAVPPVFVGPAVSPGLVFWPSSQYVSLMVHASSSTSPKHAIGKIRDRAAICASIRSREGCASAGQGIDGPGQGHLCEAEATRAAKALLYAIRLAKSG